MLQNTWSKQQLPTRCIHSGLTFSHEHNLRALCVPSFQSELRLQSWETESKFLIHRHLVEVFLESVVNEFRPHKGLHNENVLLTPGNPKQGRLPGLTSCTAGHLASRRSHKPHTKPHRLKVGGWLCALVHWGVFGFQLHVTGIAWESGPPVIEGNLGIVASELAHRRSCQELADRTPPRLNLSCPLFVPFLPSRPHRTDCPPPLRPTHDDRRHSFLDSRQLSVFCLLPFIKFSAGGSRSRLRTRSLRINVAESSTQHPRIVSDAVAEPPTPRSYSRASFDCVNPLLSLIPLSKTPLQSIQGHRDFPLDKSPFLPPLHHGGRALPRLEPTNTTLTANTDSAQVEIICDIFCHAMRPPRAHFKERLGTLLALASSRGRCAPLLLQTPPMDRHFCWHHILRSSTSPPRPFPRFASQRGHYQPASSNQFHHLRRGVPVLADSL